MAPKKVAVKKKTVKKPVERTGGITIYPEDAKKLAIEGGKFVFKKEAEDAIIELEKQILRLQNLKELIKLQIVAAGQSLDPGFKGVIGEKVRATFRRFGEKYTFDKSMQAQLEPFLKIVTWYKADSTKIEEFVKEHGTIPPGIIEKEREPKLTLEVIDEKLLETKNE